MKFWTKLFLIAFIAIAVCSGIYGLLNMLSSSWFQHAGFITVALFVVGFIGLLVAAYYGIKEVVKAKTFIVIAIGIMFVAQACSYAKSNQQVVISKDCGVNWEQIKAGESVPKGVGNRCFMKVVMPNYPMQGNAVFITNFANKVRVKLHIDYDYSIVDPLQFIREAKYLGRANADADDDGALDATAFEGAENSVIDVRLRDVSKALMEDKDLVDADISNLEDSIYQSSNEILKQKGIHLNFITLTFDLDEQTRQAIDIATAMRIYDASGLNEVGKSVMAARAGATKISVEQQPAKKDD